MTDTAVATTSPVDTQSASRLVHIPLEVLLRITSLISTTDLSSVRLTCKALEGGLFNFFSHEFFRKKQFMVSSYSLQALVDIAKHPTLSSSLKHVIISTDRLQLDTNRPQHDFPGMQDDNDRYRANLGLADHMSLMTTGGLRDMLAEAFGSLPNLETVDVRDFNANSRSRDGRGAPWRSYGALTLSRATNMAVGSASTYNGGPYVTQLFGAITAALAVSRARPKNIQVHLRKGGLFSDWGLHDSAFFITPRLESSMTQVLCGLQSLHLTLHIIHPNINPTPFITQKFLSLAPNLTWLRLNFSAVSDQSGPEQLLSWLALKDTETSVTPQDMDPIQFHRLEQLDLGNLVIQPQTLLKLVAKFGPTLTTLSLRRVALVNKNHDADLKINPWARFLSRLPKVAENLRLVQLGLLRHVTRSDARRRVRDKDRVSFLHAGIPQSEWQCSTHVVSMERAIAEAIVHLSAEWPEEVPPPANMDQLLESGTDDDDDLEEEEAGE
ncbi:hypothetical protein BT67DRAFT_437737 [Trichocladium antarcticum]|uniref:F-box domain-containing protein n=1 Tax=Trichocladium antarcticum TaxID=1450529 RepID=A0AAN6ZHT9_9PEZI|nr:hypothetical protein BT67DRAFT_437737 [Trichocladium antarcticum]